MLVEGKGNGREKARWREGQHGVPKNKRQRGANYGFKRPSFVFSCLFLCFTVVGIVSAERQKAKGVALGGWKVRLCLCGNYGSFVIPRAFFSVREPLLSFFLLFHRLTRAAVFPFPSFFSHVSPFFFTLLYS